MIRYQKRLKGEMYEDLSTRSCMRIPDKQLQITHHVCTITMYSMRTYAKINLREKENTTDSQNRRNGAGFGHEHTITKNRLWLRTQKEEPSRATKNEQITE